MFRLHQFLIGLRRRHPWLHRATTEATLLDNRRYVYVSRNGDDALLVALNLDDAAWSVPSVRHRVSARSGARR